MDPENNPMEGGAPEATPATPQEGAPTGAPEATPEAPAEGGEGMGM